MKKLLYTFFFGYAAFRYRRLIRTLIILSATICFIGIVMNSGQLFEVEGEEAPTRSLWELEGEFYEEADAINYFGQEVFNELVQTNQLKQINQLKIITQEIYYTTPNGMKMSQTEALERYGSEQFDALVNEGQLVETYYVTPNGTKISQTEALQEYGSEHFDQLVNDCQLVETYTTPNGMKMSQTEAMQSGYKLFYLLVNEEEADLTILLESLGILIGLIIIGLISFVLEPFVTKKNNEILEIKTKVASISDEITEVTQGSKSSSSSNGIRKFKFFLIYFVVFWIQAALVVVISFTIIGPRPSGLIAFGSLLSFWTSYKITKAIMSKYLKP